MHYHIKYTIMKTIEELKEEQYDAKAKLHELIEFMNNEEFYTLSKAEQGLINQQRIGLELYVSSLTKRIYGKPEEPDASNMIWLALLYGMFNTNGTFSYPNNTDPMKENLEEKDFEDSTLTEHAV